MITKLINHSFIIKTSVLMAVLMLSGFYWLNGTTFGKKFKYEGTYSLFIETQNGFSFNWITEESDSGYLELTSATGAIVSKETTPKGKVHKFESSWDGKSIAYLTFGSKTGHINKVKLKPIAAELKSSYTNVDSLFVVGDVHGRYDELINLLQKALVIDENLNWMAGRAHVVFLGDLFDRGNDVTKVLWFIYQLEDAADAAGGKVHLVLGNHEIMTMSKDLRYVGAKENALAATFGLSYDKMFHPSNSFLGRWLTSKPSVIKIDKVIFAHGGIIDLGTNSINDFNEGVINYMKKPVFLDLMLDQPDTTKYERKLWEEGVGLFYSSQSPFWYRGYVQSDTLQVQLNNMLRKYKSKVHVVAHTPLQTITQRYNGKLLTTDLNEAATELLFLERRGKKYNRFKIDKNGLKTELN